MTEENLPSVQGKCPECGSRSLFVGEGGYVTCSRIGCDDPSAPSKALGVEFDEERSDEEADEIYAHSSTTGAYYRVTEWEDLGGGKIQARSKEQVEKEDVPDEWLEAIA